jgi:fumarate reductase flavoprotein subunit
MTMPEVRGSVDLIVVGAGTGGIPAAITAADDRASVSVLDKRTVAGGMLHISLGHISGAGTRRQRERGIMDSAEGHAEEVMRISHGKVDEALMRRSVAA